VQSSPEQIAAYTNALQAELAKYSVFETTALIDADTGMVRAINGDSFIDIPLDEAAFERAVRFKTVEKLARRTAQNAAIDWVRGKERPFSSAHRVSSPS
jgi:hypothetical protein